MPATPPTVAEQLAELPEPCAHQYHQDCGEACPCHGRPESIEAFHWTYAPEFATRHLNIGSH